MITITDNKITAESKEGSKASMPVDKFVAALCPPTPEWVLPDKVKFIKRSPDGQAYVAVYEIDPGVHSVQWIKGSFNDYASGYGKDYTKRQLAMPYVVIMIPFKIATGPGCIIPTGTYYDAGCYYRNEPLTGMDQDLYYPALLNCSKFGASHEPEKRTLSWMCTQYLPNQHIMKEKGLNRQLWKLIKLHRWCLLESAFNYSSDVSEGGSHYTDYCKWEKADPRIKDVAKWEEESKENPTFVLDLDWKPTGHTMASLLERTFKLLGSANGHVLDQAYLERMVFNYR